MNNSIWLLSGSGSLPNGEMRNDNSTRIDQKRGHPWFMDTSEQELFFNKKQAIESNNETPGPVVMGGSLLRGGSSSQSEGQQAEGQRVDRPYGYMPVQSPIVSAPVNVEKTGFENQFRNNPSVCLTMSHDTAEDPLFFNNGPRKVKVDEVTLSENRLPPLASDNNTFLPGQKNNVTSSCFQRAPNSLFPGLYNTLDGNKFSVGQASNKTGGNFMFTNNYYTGINNSMLSIGQTSNSGIYNINSVVDPYGKENGNFMATGPNYNKGHSNNYFPAYPFYNKANELFMPAYSKGGTQQDADVLGPYSVLSVGEKSKEGGEQTSAISFGNPEQRDLISSYNVVPLESGQKDSSAAQQSANVVPAATSKTDGAKKTKEPKAKKASTNNFPSNVKNLLSTGMFDGVPVKYVSWSREKNLRGVVKGTGYLCSCKDCKLSKVVNAYEFERHAGCKTKHPNNHIYFENGKTIYAVVQELKSTPQESLFEVIPNVTGSAINQKNFTTWKGSFKDATRELQRIYGKDDITVAS
ncbi:hypothetical protein CASFOL_036862 [Castilleja foliolosa]|uniref:Tify domain-containing protein n=1 Tax=Castilleja foliolosa TaxID=1961234 RepID=A0ABD3BRE9_9LAMI